MSSWRLFQKPGLCATLAGSCLAADPHDYGQKYNNRPLIDWLAQLDITP
jgi:hypothetical protein